MSESYKFIHFVKVEDKKKTSVWECRSNRGDQCLAIIKWYPPWRQYCFFPEFASIHTVFSAGCLADIIHFITYRTAGRRPGGP